MTRRKIDIANKLTRKIGLRVSESFYEKMEAWLVNSNCQSIAELARAILYKEEIVWYHKSPSADAVTVELTAIRKELRAIGTNINQVTRHFNGTTLPSQKIYDALKILEEYNKVSGKITRLEKLIDELAKKW
jgi:hypothetical protein